MIEGIDTKGIENNEAILKSTFAAEMKLHSGDLFQIKDRSYTIKEIVSPCSTFPQLDVFLTLHEAESVIIQGRIASMNELMNLIKVKATSAKHIQQAIADVKELIGASAQILIGGCDPISSAVRPNTDKQCKCKCKCKCKVTSTPQ